MAGQVIFTNTLTYAAGGQDVLNPLITDLFDQDQSSFEQNNDTLNKLGFVETRALSPDQTFSIMIGAYELSEISEGQDLPTATVGKGNDKGFQIVQYGEQIGITKLFKKWLESASTLDGADSSVKAEWTRLAQNILNLRRGQFLTKNIVATQLLTEGWIDTNAAGPGSPTPYGEPLFSATHPYGNGANAGTFQNILGGSYGTLNDDLNATSLQFALDVQKSELRLQNSNLVNTPSKYLLCVSRGKAVAARAILNTAGNQVGVYSGTGTNAAQLNTFSFNGNIVEIVEMPHLGMKLKDGTLVGTEDYWFVLNAEYATLAAAMRMITLYDAEIEVYENHSNKNSYVSIDLGFAIDHYGAESYIVGSQGSA